MSTNDRRLRTIFLARLLRSHMDVGWRFRPVGHWDYSVEPRRWVSAAESRALSPQPAQQSGFLFSCDVRPTHNLSTTGAFDMMSSLNQ